MQIMMITPLILGLGTQELLLIAFIFLLLFGAKKIPELMKGLGKGVKSFKEGMDGKVDDDHDAAKRIEAVEKDPKESGTAS